jgi:hypothetical protein
VVPQSTPAGPETTVPAPVPTFDTDNAYRFMGVAAAEASDGLDAPNEFDAVTVAVYATPFVKAEMTQPVVDVVQLFPPGSTTAV